MRQVGCGAFFLLWQVRTFVIWFVIALFLAAVLNPVVNWLERRHHLIKRPLAIVLTYLGLVVALLFVVGLLLPILVYQQIEGSILQPLVYSHAVQLNALVIFIAVLAGGILLGIPGALLAIPVAQIIRIVVTEVVAYRRAIQEANEPAVASPSQPIT